MQDQRLLEITEVTDDETGIWQVGEIEFGIYGTLEEYLRAYGKKGKDEILKTLDYLKREVQSRFDRLNSN